MSHINHWHTYIYPKKARLDPDSPFFIRANGEFVRSSDFDYGVLGHLANLASPVSLVYFWNKRLEEHFIFNKEELKGFNPELQNEFTKENKDLRVRRFVNLCHHRFLRGLDRFLLEQRVRNFIGNGLKLYGAYASWRAPFLNRQWVNAIWSLKTGWKLGSNWHRFAIANNYPRLLDFVTTGSVEKVSQRAPLLYWLPYRNKYPIIPYARYPEWFSSDLIVDFILENAYMLSELIEKDMVRSIVLQHKRDRNRVPAVAFLINMIFWHINLREESSRNRL